mmetsp:Transcript_19406/g.50456  ORF Transcript_19406/g.50456 Transcript_19406/m.50456 type:complete len:206 (+) Transcript_19406:344-961(+)
MRCHVHVHLDLEGPWRASAIISDSTVVEKHIGDVAKVCATDGHRATSHKKPPEDHLGGGGITPRHDRHSVVAHRDVAVQHCVPEHRPRHKARNLASPSRGKDCDVRLERIVAVEVLQSPERGVRDRHIDNRDGGRPDERDSVWWPKLVACVPKEDVGGAVLVDPALWAGPVGGRPCEPTVAVDGAVATCDGNVGGIRGRQQGLHL